jgi:hypothetical protein
MEQAVTLKTIGIRVFLEQDTVAATIGARYNVLNDANNIYGSLSCPVRVYFKKNRTKKQK